MNGVRSVLRELRLPAAALVGGLIVSLAISWLLGLSDTDIQRLAVYLTLSGLASVVAGTLAIKLAPSVGLTGLRSRMDLTHLIVLFVVFVNIAVTAGLMFFSQHDLLLLGLLLAFAAIVSLALARMISGDVVSSVSELAVAAREVAGGRLETRVRSEGSDELADLAVAFNMMAAKLDEAEQARIEMEQARRHLVAAISHDLRTPLASIRAMVEAMSDGVVTDAETIERYVRFINGEVGRLSSLIDDLFELSRLEAGDLSLHLEPGSLRDLMSDTLESWQPQVAARGLRLAGHVDSDLPPVVMDASRVQRVLHNLIQNALRHTPPGGAIVLEANEDGDMVRVEVSDSGEGIPAADLPYIFERSYRGEKSRARGEGGAGLGLAIARGLVEAHGGRIWVENLPGRGARFCFVLAKTRES